MDLTLKADRAGRLLQLGDDLTRIISVPAVAEHVLAWLGQTFDLIWAEVSLHRAAYPERFQWGNCPSGEFTPTADTVGAPSDGSRYAEVGSARSLPLIASGVTLGTLVIGPRRDGAEWSDEGQLLLAAITPLVALSLQGAGLLAELENQAAVLGERERELAALTGQLMRAQEEERARIAQEIHDDPLQRAILLSRRMAHVPDAGEVPQWRTAVTEIADGLQAICAGLRPRVLDDFGLVAGLEWLAETLQAQGDTAIQLAAETADGSPFGRLAPDLELALFRIAQESLNNCLKHAQATRIVVILWREGSFIRLSVSDNGRGCHPWWNDEGARFRLGMIGMAERLRPWGGRVQMGPGSNGGTMVVAELDLQHEHCAI